jgi:hypothetical protein
MLTERYGYVITYEDAPLTYKEDLQDLTLERHADLSYLKKPGTVRELVPMSEALTIKPMPASAMNDPKNMLAVIDQMLKDHEVSNRGGRFHLQQTDGVFHIVPSEVRDSSGQWVLHAPVLDTKITLPELERSGPATLEAICKAVSDATHIPVGVGHIPINALASYHGVLAARDEPARNVLMRMLNGTGHRLTWLLEYDAGTQRYYLGVMQVPDRPSSTVPSPTTTTQPGVETKAAAKAPAGVSGTGAATPK